MIKRTIKDTDKSRNTQVTVTGDMSLDAMEAVLADVGEDLGLVLSHITTLSRKKYPNNRHWHFKEDLGQGMFGRYLLARRSVVLDHDQKLRA